MLIVEFKAQSKTRNKLQPRERAYDAAIMLKAWQNTSETLKLTLRHLMHLSPETPTPPTPGRRGALDSWTKKSKRKPHPKGENF